MRKGLTRYAGYVPSGVPWIGELPRGWQVRRLKKVCRRIITGSTPPDEAFDESDEDGGIPWHTPGDFRTGSVNLVSSSKRLHQDALSAGTVRRFPAGSTLLVGIGATLGKVAVTDHDCSGNQQINCLIPSDDADGRFIALLLSVMTPSLKVSANAATLGILNQTKTGEFVIPCPPLPEQEAIVAFLDRETAKIDRLKDVRRRQIEVLREQRAAVIHHAVTQGLDPNAPKKDSGIPWLGEVPEHWEVRRLKYWADHCSVQVNSFPEGARYLALEHIESKTGKILPDDAETTFESSVKIFKAGDVLFGRLRPYLAKVVCPDFNGVCVGELLVIRPRKGQVLSRFLHMRLLTQSFIDLVDGSTQGAKMPRANWWFMGNQPIPMPPLTEQEAIVAHIDAETATIDALIGKYERELELLDEYRASLISHAVTGKIDVRGLVEGPEQPPKKPLPQG